MQGRRTFAHIDAWLQRYVSSGIVRLAVMVTGLILLHVVIIALVSGLVELLTWLLT